MLGEIDREPGAWPASVRRASPNGFAAISIASSEITEGLLILVRLSPTLLLIKEVMLRR